MKITAATAVHYTLRSRIYRPEVTMKLLSAAVAVLLVALTNSAGSLAHADSRSWAAVKGSLPDNVTVVAGANLSALRGTSLYQSIVPRLLAKDPDAQQAFDLTKSTCSIDLHSAIVDVTFAIGADERGVVALALDKSLDQKRILDCVTKVAAGPAATPGSGGLKGGAKKKQAAPKIVVKKTGKITEYGVAGDADRIYVAWLAPDVAAIATDPEDRALLAKMLGGKGARGTIARYLTKSGSNAAVWLASTKAQSIQSGVDMKGAFGTIDTARGNVSIDMNLVLSSAKEAKGFVEQATQLIASMKSSIPPQFQKLVDALRLTAAADAANVKLTASEKDVMSVLALAMANL